MHKDMEQWTAVRHALFVEKISKREACQRFRLNFRTIQKIFNNEMPIDYERSASSVTKITPFLPFIQGYLDEDPSLPPKQRHTGKAMIILDRLTSHVSARNFFECVHPDWFLFAAEYRSNELPSYSPELNPVEQCWQTMKNVFMVNFVPLSVEHLEEKAFEAAQILNNDPMLLASFFHHVKLAL